MTVLPWLLLASTLLVRLLLARHDRRGFYLDLLTVPLWTLFYVDARAWPLIVIPYVFAYLDVRALRVWWR